MAFLLSTAITTSRGIQMIDFAAILAEIDERTSLITGALLIPFDPIIHLKAELFPCRCKVCNGSGFIPTEPTNINAWKYYDGFVGPCNRCDGSGHHTETSEERAERLQIERESEEERIFLANERAKRL